ncbi:MAG: hypothetical protein Ct9H300mP32_0400 [Verrucomicrobiota bacterium]|nr:MAG: hypothetical protein Ct9H300mP32_0400 [Verrucomicrobiota bacterium]
MDGVVDQRGEWFAVAVDCLHYIAARVIQLRRVIVVSDLSVGLASGDPKRRQLQPCDRLVDRLGGSVADRFQILEIRICATLAVGETETVGALCVCVAPIKICPGGIDFTFRRTRSPNTAGKPRKSVLTNATRVPSFSRTNARTVRSPFFLVTGLDGPTPPDTGSNGSGVTIRTAIPARNSACTSTAWPTPRQRG